MGPHGLSRAVRQNCTWAFTSTSANFCVIMCTMSMHNKPGRPASSPSRRPMQPSSMTSHCIFYLIRCLAPASLSLAFVHLFIIVERVAIRHHTSQLGCACIPYWDATASGHTDWATNVACGSLRLSEPESQKRRTRARSYASLMCIRHTM